MRTSDELRLGATYSREELARRFSIKDATIFTGIFRPKGHDSIWLFITRDKTPDRTQYKDNLLGDDLFIDGQKSGRKDRLLAEHFENDLEVLLFYRKSKKESENAGFLFEGLFRYVDHVGSKPARFHFRRVKS